jgi:8-oxo-dGTP pyrophosphatase MutT (NUDIX family)
VHNSLHAELLRYQPSDSRELAFREQMLRLLDTASAPFSRDHFMPGHFTASAFILSPEGDALLLIHHSKLLRWLQPGGHVAPEDATLLATARREVAEEVQLSDLPLDHDGIFDLDVHVIPARKQDPTHQHFDVRYLMRAPHHGAVAGSDATAARWVKLDALDQVQSDESVRRAARKLG